MRQHAMKLALFVGLVLGVFLVGCGTPTAPLCGWQYTGYEIVFSKGADSATATPTDSTYSCRTSAAWRG